MDDSKNPTSPTAAGQCRHLKPDGSRCQANTLRESDYCFFHDPNSAVDREAAQSKGGKERSRRVSVLPADTPDRPLANAADVKVLLGETINQLRRGQLDPHVCNAIGYLAGILLRAADQDALEQRVAHLEAVVADQQATSVSDSEFEFVNPDPGR